MASTAPLASPETRVVTRGCFVYAEGDRADSCFVVEAGAVKNVVRSAGGREAITHVAGPGELFGEDSLYSERRTGAAEAMTSSVVRAVAEPRFASLTLINMLSHRFGEDSISLEAMLLLPPQARIALRLANLAGRHGRVTAGGVFIPYRVTQSDLAQMCGTTRETVNKFLLEFIEMGWVRRLGPGRYYVTDRAKLVEFAESSG